MLTELVLGNWFEYASNRHEGALFDARPAPAARRAAAVTAEVKIQFLIHQLREEGLSISAIARRVGLDRKTVHKYLKTGLKAPSSGPHAPRVQLLDPYRSYLRYRVTAYPSLRATRMLREIGTLGYPGGYSQLLEPLN